MSKIKIITDAASDISSEDELKYGIRVIPFQVTLGDESYTTRVDMDNAQFYARMAQCDEIPKTAQVNPFQFQEIYLQEAQAGYTDLILVLINSEGSATYGNSLLAAEQFFEEHPEYRDRVHIHSFDGLGYSALYGAPVIEAARMAESGADAGINNGCIPYPTSILSGVMENILRDENRYTVFNISLFITLYQLRSSLL